jgi:F-type H+-transporting ATPase subunit b
MENVGEAIKHFIDGALGVNLMEMGIQIASTLLLFLVVKYFFWSNITEYLDKRKKGMEDEFTNARYANESAQTLKLEAEKAITDIRLEAKEIFEDAKSQGEIERSIIIGKAKKDAEYVMETAQNEINREIEKVKSDINDEIVNVAILMAEKVVNREIDREKHDELIREISNRVSN